MRKRNKTILRITALAIAVAMPVTTAVYSFADEAADESSQVSKYEKPNINDLTGHGEEPEELSVSAAATYQEKAWYEYVTYSDEAVCSYRLDDNMRLLFYDPYTYTNSLIMDVQFNAASTSYDTMSSYTISDTKSKTISSAAESTYTNTKTTQTSGRDKTYSSISNSGTQITDYNHTIDEKTTGEVGNKTEYHYKEVENNTRTVINESLKGLSVNTLIQEEVEIKVGTEIGAGYTTVVGLDTGVNSSTTTGEDVTYGSDWIIDTTDGKTTYSDLSTTAQYNGSDEVSYNSDSVSAGWVELSARIAKTIGTTNAICESWSETESTTITKTYAATHFAVDGVTPLPWAIVHYTIQMPMKCCLQFKVSGEWVSASTIYCLLTTVRGTCRTWMENGQAYYEDWGNGEPVTATDFWSQFLTKEQLINAYSNKLYPTGGEN